MRKNYFPKCTAFAGLWPYLKSYSLTAFLIIFLNLTLSGTTYTFSGVGNWTDEDKWSTYPGLFISTGDEIIISTGSTCTIPTGEFFSNDGTITINNDAILINEGLVFNNGFNGTIAITGTFTSNHNLINDGTINNLGTFINNSSFNNDNTLTGNGMYKGSGTIESSNPAYTFNNTGTLAPGNSPGCSTFNTNFENANTGLVQIELGGTTACTQSDKISVIGTATLDGTLTVTLVSGYTGTGTDNITILDATSITGTFATVNLPAHWSINYNSPTAGKITLTYNATLPVELLNFQAHPLSNSVELNWQTADEINNKGFEIEKRGVWSNEWKSIGFVAAKGKSSSYEFMDSNPLSTNYYRLRQMDNDGKSSLSKVISATLDGIKVLKIYPSKISDDVLNIENEKVENLPYSIYNMLGQPLKIGNATSQINISTLPRGAYILRIGTEQAKFVKE